jgi:hypothetical protein
LAFILNDPKVVKILAESPKALVAPQFGDAVWATDLSYRFIEKHDRLSFSVSSSAAVRMGLMAIGFISTLC